MLLIGILLIAWLTTQFGLLSEKTHGELTIFTYTSPQFQGLFGNETEKIAPFVWEKVRYTDEAKSVIPEKDISILVYMHLYTFGEPTPETAEWVVIISSIPDTTDEVKIVIFRLDYQSLYLKKTYRFSYPAREELTFEESITIMEEETRLSVNREEVWRIHANYIYSYPAHDFGGTIIVNRYAGKAIFYATTVWMGSGTIVIPEE